MIFEYSCKQVGFDFFRPCLWSTILNGMNKSAFKTHTQTHIQNTGAFL